MPLTFAERVLGADLLGSLYFVAMRLAFGERVLDTARRQLFAGAREVHLTPKAYRLLEVLLERRPAAVSKDALLAAVWPGLIVGEGSLSNLVAQLRAALGDEGERPELVRTVHGFGYAFEGRVQELVADLPGAVRWYLVWNGRRYPLAEGESIVGRGRESQIWIQDERISRRHARFRVGADGATLEDLGSRNGTFRGGERIAGVVRLVEGDRIQIGPAELTIGTVAADGTTVADSEAARGAPDAPREPGSGAAD